MRITYDSKVDALYIRFIETTVTSRPLAEGIVADFDARGKLAGIEILDARRRFDDKALAKVTVEGIGLDS